ncbi:MAG: inositol monophosphatase family protein [Rhizobiaceae bacterium]|nr:inositol monophosphatase family protein [Rhizobiaceae bacterium]
MSDEQQRLAFTIDLAQRAGELGMRFFRELDKLTIESKGHQDLVSNGDREVELFVRAAIAERYPQDGIVGEEHAPVSGSSGYRWIIDPIDGTANFVRGIPAWAVVIACVHDGSTVVGVVHEPCSGETFSARLGGGAFVNGRPIRVTSATSLTQGSVGVGCSNRSVAGHVLPLIEMLLGAGGLFFRNASGALMLAYVGAGRLLGYAEEHMNAWDCLAAMLIIEEAGGIVEQPDTQRMIEHGMRVLAGGPGVYDAIRDMALDAFSR